MPVLPSELMVKGVHSEPVPAAVHRDVLRPVHPGPVDGGGGAGLRLLYGGDGKGFAFCACGSESGD